MGYLEHIDRLNDRVVSSTKKAYGENLVSVVLFGSAARRTSRPDSDVDLLIIRRECLLFP